MSWPTSFMPVPTDRLDVDLVIRPESTHGYSEADLREIAATIPFVYDELAAGRTDAEMQIARRSEDPRDRALGETYCKLFRGDDAVAPIRAHLDGGRLVVDSGNHRVASAKAIGVPVVPVMVSAPNEAVLTDVESNLRQAIPEHFAIHQRSLEHFRSSNRSAVREAGPEAERPRDWGAMERDR